MKREWRKIAQGLEGGTPFMCRRYNSLLGEIHVPSGLTHIRTNDPLITNAATLWARPGLWDFLPFRTILSYVKRNRMHQSHGSIVRLEDIFQGFLTLAIALFLTTRARLRLLFHFLAERGIQDAAKHWPRLSLHPFEHREALSLPALFLRPSRLRVHPATRFRNALHQLEEMLLM